MIINTNKKSFVDNKHIIKTKYDFLFKNYFQLLIENNDIKAIYLIGDWNQVNINLTKLFEENKIIFEIQKPNEINKYHNIIFENNHNLNKFVECYKEQWKFIKSQSDVDKMKSLEDLLDYMDYDLLEYFESIIYNYFIR